MLQEMGSQIIYIKYLHLILYVRDSVFFCLFVCFFALFFAKEPIEHILDFTGYEVSVITILLCCCKAKQGSVSSVQFSRSVVSNSL